MTQEQRDLRDLVAHRSMRLRKVLDRALDHAIDGAVALSASNAFTAARLYLDSLRPKLVRCVICDYFRLKQREHCPYCGCIIIEGYAIQSMTGTPMVKGEPAVIVKVKGKLLADGRRDIGLVCQKQDRVNNITTR